MTRLRGGLAAFLLLFTLPAAALDGPATPPLAVGSKDALAFLKFDMDFEDKPGWIMTVRTGYQWKLYHNAGFTATGGNYADGMMTKRKTHTNSGLSTMLGLGYNFGPKYPVTFTLGVGSGLSGNLDTRAHFRGDVGGDIHDFFVRGRQKLRYSVLDIDVDYEFKNASRWTPFVGVIGGLSFLSYRNKLEIQDLTLDRIYWGAQDKKKRTTLVAGARAGFKWDLNERVGLSLYGSYTYLGEAPSQQFRMSDGGQASSRAIGTHEVNLKLGVKYHF